MVDSPYASSLTKADLEDAAMKRATVPDDPGEMNELDRLIVPATLLRIEVPLRGNRLQLRHCLGRIRAWVERCEATTRRNELTDRTVALEVWALTRCLQEELRPERRKEISRQRRLSETGS